MNRAIKRLAKSTFGKDYGHEGQPLEKIFMFQTVSISMMHVMKLLKIIEPDYIKMTFDSFQHLIFKGGFDSTTKLKRDTNEIDEGFEKQSVDSTRRLHDAGLVLKETRQSNMFKDSYYSTVYNQIWHSPSKS